MQNDHTVRFSIKGEHVTTLPLCASNDGSAVRIATLSRVGFDIEVRQGDRLLCRSADGAVIKLLPASRTTMPLFAEGPPDQT